MGNVDSSDALRVAAVAGLMVVSAASSGLNLGLMRLEPKGLAVLVDAATRPDADAVVLQEAEWARRVLPFREDGNTLLCTLLLINVMANACIPILLADFWGAVATFIVSTLLLVTLCETLPQAVCHTRGLRIGAACVPVLACVWYLLLPVTKPLALMLDRTFGAEIGQLILNRHHLLALIDQQRKGAPESISEQEVKLLDGALRFSSMAVSSIMVPLSDCFCLDLHAMVSPGLCTAVATAGYSRVPVVDRSVANKRQLAVVGLIHVKDLLVLNTEQEVPLKTLLPLIGRQVFVVDDDQLLPEVLAEFRRGASQLAVVRELVSGEDCDPYFKHSGLVTLQDLVNTIVQDNVQEVDAKGHGYADETDFDRMPSGLYSNVGRFSEEMSRSSFYTDGYRAAAVAVRALSGEEAVAVGAFLRRRHMQLFGFISHEDLEFFVRECPLVGARVEGRRALYSRGEDSDFATLVISGQVKVFAGREAFGSMHGPWTLLARRCLELSQSCDEEAGAAVAAAIAAQRGRGVRAPYFERFSELQDRDPKAPYTPDFSAYTAEESAESGREGTTRLLILSAEAYSELLKKTARVRVII